MAEKSEKEKKKDRDAYIIGRWMVKHGRGKGENLKQKGYEKS